MVRACYCNYTSVAAHCFRPRRLQELLPGNYKPTPTHFFLTLLHKKGLLQRCFTQNIDSLEVAAGLPKDMVIAAHGNFDTASCVDCGKSAELGQVLLHLSQEQVCLSQGSVSC